MDYQTIDIDRLRKLPTWTSPGHVWSLQDSPGNGCFLDPPGYPTYYTRSIYRNGNNPSRGPETVITFEDQHYVVARVDESYEAHQQFLHSLWRPLPLEHPRVQLWILEAYRHLHYCYRDDEGQVAGPNDNRTVIYPVPNYKLDQFHDDPRFSDEYRKAERHAIYIKNAALVTRTAVVATARNHSAYRMVVKFYPEHQPDQQLIEKVPASVTASWWETEAERPTPETCRPRLPASWGAGGRHPTGGSWCQWCGWSAEP